MTDKKPAAKPAAKPAPRVEDKATKPEEAAKAVKAGKEKKAKDPNGQPVVFKSPKKTHTLLKLKSRTFSEKKEGSANMERKAYGIPGVKGGGVVSVKGGGIGGIGSLSMLL